MDPLKDCQLCFHLLPAESFMLDVIEFDEVKLLSGGKLFKMAVNNIFSNRWAVRLSRYSVLAALSFLIYDYSEQLIPMTDLYYVVLIDF